MSTIKVNGHLHHIGSPTLVIEGNYKEPNSLGMARDARMIAGFLRDNLPSGTLDVLAAMLAHRLIERLEHPDQLTPESVADVKAALAAFLKEIPE